MKRATALFKRVLAANTTPYEINVDVNMRYDHLVSLNISVNYWCYTFRFSQHVDLTITIRTTESRRTATSPRPRCKRTCRQSTTKVCRGTRTNGASSTSSRTLAPTAFASASRSALKKRIRLISGAFYGSLSCVDKSKCE